MHIPDAKLFTDPFVLLTIFGVLAVAAMFLGLAAIIQQRRSRVQLAELQERLVQLELAEDRRVIQSLNRPARGRRASRKESSSADKEAPSRIVEAPPIGGDTQP